MADTFSLPMPTTNSTPVPRNALSTFGSASYSFTLLTCIDWRSHDTRDGEGRLSAICP